jgi:hypothetical protein
VTLVAKLEIGYFLEDMGHQRFLLALVERVAKETGLSPDRLHHEVRSATGGLGKALGELRRFLRDVHRERSQPFNLMVVAIDSNCQGYSKRRQEIRGIVKRSGYQSPVVCAVPEPHIERWYLADPSGFQKALGSDAAPEVPPYKCERGRYKDALRQAVQRTGIVAPLGGLEYGSAIALALNLYAAGKANAGFKHFVDDVRAVLAPLVQQREEQ